MRKSRRSIAVIRRSGLGVCVVSGGVLALADAVRANLTITPTFQSSITSDPNAAAIEASINTAISNFQNYIANPVTANISFGETTSGLGQSSSSLYGPSYQLYLQQLKGAQTLSADDNAAIASLGAGTVNNPVNGNATIYATGPVLRALGFSANPASGIDTTILFNESIIYNSRSSPVFGEYDLQSVVSHEIDEALGIGGPGSQLNDVLNGIVPSNGPVGPTDLFRYSASGTRSYSTSNGVSSYFSIDGGNTDFVHFNQNGPADNSDYGDWGDGVTPADGQPNVPAQVQDAYGSPYEGNAAQAQPDLGPNELAALDVIGWNLTPAGSALEAVLNITWNDASANNLWDTTSSNWNNGSANIAFSNGTKITFNDSNGGHYAVTLNTTVAPASITANNSSGHYTIGGTGSIKTTGSLSKIGTGVFTINTTGTSLGAVSVTAGSLQLGTSTGLATVTSLAISAPGTFDVANNHVIINYGGGADPIASIAALLATGYNGGAWNGAGGIVTTAPLVVGGLSYGLGYADSTDAGNPAGLSAGTIEIKYTLLGDADLNGIVNGLDFGILAANFNKGVTGWDKGDFDYNNIVNGIDFGFLAANFNKGASGASAGAPAWADPALVAFASANGLLADVPEPASLTLCAIAGAGLLGRRRKQPGRA